VRPAMLSRLLEAHELILTASLVITSRARIGCLRACCLGATRRDTDILH
jgi:hypothetical protein